MPDGIIFGTGHQQEATPDRQRAAATTHEKAYEYAVKSQTHLWIVLMQHCATDVLLDAMEGKGDGLPLLDVDTMMGAPMVGCYVCEASYEPRLRRRRCPGESPS